MPHEREAVAVFQIARSAAPRVIRRMYTGSSFAARTTTLVDVSNALSFCVQYSDKTWNESHDAHSMAQSSVGSVLYVM